MNTKQTEKILEQSFNQIQRLLRKHGEKRVKQRPNQEEGQREERNGGQNIRVSQEDEVA